MLDKQYFKTQIKNVKPSNFEDFALKLFHYQSIHNTVYKEYINKLGITNALKINSLEEIPFLPIEAFKYHTIKTGDFIPEKIFESSGTTHSLNAKKHIANVTYYYKVATNIFEQFYGALSGFVFLALLPNYLERNNSSLVAMISHFINNSKSNQSGFYLYDHESLFTRLQVLKKSNKKVILWGVTFALLDFIENFAIKFPNLIIIETGGMKGRRKELLRTELHDIIKKKISTNHIHSEYGMTELTSQAYRLDNKGFQLPAWMRVFIRDITDPFTHVNYQKTGGINIIDLANVDTCAFIETKDLGRLSINNKFEVLGRFDNADLRGCNLMVL